MFKIINIRDIGHFFEITFKNRFVSICTSISEYINISTKTMFWEKIVLCLYVRKYQHFGVKHLFEIILEKLLSISSKMSNFEEKVFLFRYLWKCVFLPICSKLSTFQEKNIFWENIKISTKTMVFRSFWKKNFFCSYFRKYQYFGIKYVLEILMKKSLFGHIAENIKFRGKGTFL